MGLGGEDLFVWVFFKSGKLYISISYLVPSNACFYLPGINLLF